MNSYDLPLRLTRMRQSKTSRSLMRETQLQASQLIAPVIINANIGQKKEISSMPGQYQFSLVDVAEHVNTLSSLGIPAVLLFGVPKAKDALGSASYQKDGVIQQAIQRIRQVNQDILIITDLCFCEYTDHGHCGVLKDNHIDNAATLNLLQRQAVSHAQAGADWVAPSGMADGMVGAIRQGLDKSGFQQTAIFSYAVKYCSCLYEPFRKAAEGAPKFGNRKSYQMDPANSREALREVMLDIEEGADVVMVKPAIYYLDIIYRLKEQFPEVPLATYQVGGEYSMIKAAAKAGYINEGQAILESLLSMKRSGADMIISYFAKDAAKLLSNQDNS